jgi:hypothetical protein
MHANNTMNLPGTVDPDQGKRHHFTRLLSVPVGRSPHFRSEVNAILDASPEAVSARRKAVEKAVELYVALTDERQSVKLNAAVLVALKSMDFRAAKDVKNLQLSIGWVLGRMTRACGPCRSHRLTCRHREELEQAARLKHLIAGGRGLADACGRQLGSATTRQGMAPDHRKIATNRCKSGNATAERAAQVRGSLIRRASYAEACELFYLAASLDPTTKLAIFRESE